MALRLPKQDYQDIERVIELDFVRATEAAALNSLRWLGRGDKEAADAAASDAIRGMFDLMNICGEVVIGEGIKDNAPGIFKGEVRLSENAGRVVLDALRRSPAFRRRCSLNQNLPWMAWLAAAVAVPCAPRPTTRSALLQLQLRAQNPAR